MNSVTVGSALGRFFSERGYDRRRNVETVFTLWEQIVGEDDAKLAHPLSLEKGVLTLAVSNATVGSEVLFSQERFKDRLNTYFGSEAVTEVRTRVHRGKKREPSVFAQCEPEDAFDFNPDDVTLNADELARIEQIAANVGGKKAHSSFKRALTMQMKRRKWDAQSARSETNRAAQKARLTR
ncbi:MAG: DUF721 domain-containing protein [Candidatus Poribacteria bacterium]|nr:DUF721 domain-containing protein [Candidatus Poribacteria bacterium]